MRRDVLVFLVLLVFGGITLLTAAAPSLRLAAFDAKVVDVHDGDTITVQVKVRLRGIDAPELKQEYGPAARESLAALLRSGECRVVPRDVDKYGRMVGDVYVAGDVSANSLLVSQGNAWWYRAYAPDDTDLKTSEAQAREAKRGLWSGNPIPPWEWRRKH